MNRGSSNKQQSNINKYKTNTQQSKKKGGSGFCANFCLLFVVIAIISGVYYYEQIAPAAINLHQQFKNSNETAFQLIKKTLQVAIESAKDKINAQTISTETISTKTQSIENGVKVQSHSQKVVKTTKRTTNQNGNSQKVQQTVVKKNDNSDM